MKNLQEVVRDFFMEPLDCGDTRIRSWLSHGWDTASVLDQSRFRCTELCMEAGVGADDTAIANMILKLHTLMPEEDWFVPIGPPPAFTLVPGEVAARPRYVSRYAGLDVTPEQHSMMDILQGVIHVCDEELFDIGSQVYRSLTSAERESFCPDHVMAYAPKIVGKEFCLPCGFVSADGRCFYSDRNRASAQGSKAARVWTTRPDAVLTKLSDQEAYMKRIGIDVDPSVVIADPLDYILHCDDVMEGYYNYGQCLSWYRINKTLRKNGWGLTDILSEFDQAVSGWAHIEAKLRRQALLTCSNPLEPSFCDPRVALWDALKSSTPELIHLSTDDKMGMSFAKDIFTPSIYDAGQAGLFNGFTGKNSVESLLGKKKFKAVPIPEILAKVWETVYVITDKEGKTRVDHKACADALWEHCSTWKKSTREALPDLRVFSNAIHADWDDRAGAMGLLVVQSDGEVVLCPRQRREPQGSTTVEYNVRWYDRKTKSFRTSSATLRAPRMDDEGTGSMAFSCHNDDACTMRKTVINSVDSKGNALVRQQIFDAVIGSLRDMPKIQRVFRNEFNGVHSEDRLNTGRKQVLVTADMLR